MWDYYWVYITCVFLCVDKKEYLTFLIFTLFIPLGLYILFYNCSLFVKMRYEKPVRNILFLLIFGLSIGDLLYSYKWVDFLYDAQNSPAKDCGVKVDTKVMLYPSQRELNLPSCISQTGQSIRYLSLLERKAVAISPFRAPSSESTATFTQTSFIERWGYFFSF